MGSRLVPVWVENKNVKNSFQGERLPDNPGNDQNLQQEKSLS